MAYKYTCPTERGYKQFKLTRKEHNEILPKRKQNIFTKIDAYYKPNRIELHYSTNALGKIVSTIFFPIVIIMHGLSSTKEIVKEYKDLFNEKKTGSFVTEFVLSTRYDGSPSEIFRKLEEIYEKQRD